MGGSNSKGTIRIETEQDGYFPGNRVFGRLIVEICTEIQCDALVHQCLWKRTCGIRKYKNRNYGWKFHKLSRN